MHQNLAKTFKKHEKGEIDQSSECASPKHWLKYATKSVHAQINVAQSNFSCFFSLFEQIGTGESNSKKFRIKVPTSIEDVPFRRQDRRILNARRKRMIDRSLIRFSFLLALPRASTTFRR